jgi:hypothetical protein
VWHYPAQSQVGIRVDISRRRDLSLTRYIGTRPKVTALVSASYTRDLDRRSSDDEASRHSSECGGKEEEGVAADEMVSGSRRRPLEGIGPGTCLGLVGDRPQESGRWETHNENAEIEMAPRSWRFSTMNAKCSRFSSAHDPQHTHSRDRLLEGVRDARLAADGIGGRTVRRERQGSMASNPVGHVSAAVGLDGM